MVHRYVLDSCVAVKRFLAEHDSAKAIQLLDDANGQIHELSRRTFSQWRSPTRYLGQSAVACFYRPKGRSTCPISSRVYPPYTPH